MHVPLSKPPESCWRRNGPRLAVRLTAEIEESTRAADSIAAEGSRGFRCGCDPATDRHCRLAAEPGAVKKIFNLLLGVVTSIGGFVEAGSISTAAQGGAEFGFE